MHLAIGEDLSHSTNLYWILGGLGISIMAFLLGCVNCRQRKEPVIASRRPAPPTPESGSLSRYQTGPFASSNQIAEIDADDYEEDFEVPAPRKDSPKTKSNSPSLRKSTAETNSRSSYANVGKGSPTNPIQSDPIQYRRCVRQRCRGCDWGQPGAPNHEEATIIHPIQSTFRPMRFLPHLGHMCVSSVLLLPRTGYKMHRT
ncbi:hypothetical protein XENTR_v10023002 [Xenopus tropicalis]|nr:hypothetical protein XENTR_v10023002 [Xenopus tropicalis]